MLTLGTSHMMVRQFTPQLMLFSGIQVQDMDPWGSTRDTTPAAGIGFEDSFSPQDKDQQGEGLLNL